MSTITLLLIKTFLTCLSLDLDLKIVYGYVHLSWDTVALETTLVFYEESKNKPAVHTVKTTDDYYRLQINTDDWLVNINDKTMIIVQVLFKKTAS